MNKNRVIFFLLVCVLLLGAVCFRLRQENSILQGRVRHLTPSQDFVAVQAKKEGCTPKVIEYTVSGESMMPLIKNGQKIQVSDAYYECGGKVTRGDIIIYESFTTNGPIIKRVQALPGDIVKFENGKMFINGDLLKNSTGQEYVFRADEVKYMSMYVQDGRLQKDAFFAFGDNIQNSIDSRKMGGLGVANFKGKVVLGK